MKSVPSKAACSTMSAGFVLGHLGRCMVFQEVEIGTKFR